MSVRHIHARPGEYIAVHRGGTYSTSRSKTSGDGAVFVIGFILLLVFWKLILTAVVAGFVLYFAAKFIWLYRVQIWNGLRTLGGMLWNGLRTSGGILWNTSCSCYFHIRRWLANRKACPPMAVQPQQPPTPIYLPPTGNSQNTYKSSAAYGKIVQRH